MQNEDRGKIQLVAFKAFAEHENLVYVVDFLNKSLKQKNIMFGITRDKDNKEMTIKIYEY